MFVFGGEVCFIFFIFRKWRFFESNSLIYNFYGIIEVFCWVFCYKIIDRELEDISVDFYGILIFGYVSLESYKVSWVSEVFFGIFLIDIIIEVRDVNGKIVLEGVG